MGGSLSQEDLDRAVRNLKEHIDVKFTAQQAYDKLIHKELIKDVAHHDMILHGDGNGIPGLKIKVDRIQTGYKIIKRVVAGFMGVLTLLGTYLGLKFK